MRSILSILVLLLVVNITFSQTIIEHSVVDNIKDRGALLHINDGKLIYHFQEGTYKNFEQKYSVMDYKTGKHESYEFDDIKYEKLGGKVFGSFGDGEFIYEIVRFVKSNFVVKSQVGLIKRNISDFEQVGDIVWLGEFGIFNAMESPNIAMIKGKDCFYLLSGVQSYGDQVNFYAKYDLDFNEIWKKDMSFLSEDGVSLRDWEINDEGNIIIALNLTATDKKWSWAPKVSSSGLAFVCVSNGGEMKVISPTLTSNMYVKGCRIQYLSKTDELVGVFLVSKLLNEKNGDNEGVGYTYYRWDNEGAVVHTNTTYFTLDDYKKSGYFDAYAEESNLPINKLTTKSGDLRGLHRITYNGLKVEFDEEGGAIVAINGYDLRIGLNGKPIDDIFKSKLLISITPEGEKKWLNFFPYHINTKPSYMITQLDNGKIHMFTPEYLDNFPGDDFVMNNASRMTSWKNIIPAERVIDQETGEIESFRKIGEIQEGLRIYGGTQFNEYTDENTILFIYSDQKKKTMFLEYNRD